MSLHVEDDERKRSSRGCDLNKNLSFVWSMKGRPENEAGNTRRASVAVAVFHEALAAFAVGKLIGSKLRREGARLLCEGGEIDLEAYREVVVIGFGKAALEMGK